eukprot:1076076-Alexandrium_andersonii.AAC.1
MAPTSTGFPSIPGSWTGDLESELGAVMVLGPPGPGSDISEAISVSSRIADGALSDSSQESIPNGQPDPVLPAAGPEMEATVAESSLAPSEPPDA